MHTPSLIIGFIAGALLTALSIGIWVYLTLKK